MSVALQVRNEIVDYLKGQLVGPSNGPSEWIESAPHNRYLMGTLFPKALRSEERYEEDEGEGLATNASDEDPISMAGQWMPSSLGVSVHLNHGEELAVHVRCGIYVQETFEERKGWRRRQLPKEALVVGRAEGIRQEVFGGRAYVHFRWRRFGEGFIVTISLVNAQQSEPDNIDPSQALYQVEMSCRPVNGKFTGYPRYDLLVADDEEQELQLLYRRHCVYAVGHGCSAEWNLNELGEIEEIRTEMLPAAELKPVTTRLSEDDEKSGSVLRIADLANDLIPLKDLTTGLEQFVDCYEGWIRGLDRAHLDIHPRLTSAKDRLLTRLHEAARRMREGIAAISSGVPSVAFRLANQAMLMQMTHSAEERAGTRRSRDQAVAETPDYLQMAFEWRPFQLAFLLLVAASIVDENRPDRDIVDLIWFPTGGGKTEAYLLVAAFQIFLRRLRDPDRGQGTVVLTRYTLRLLTSQQFQRASALVCATEVIRRNNPSLGKQPISIGLWIGSSGSPNTFKEARKQFEELRTSVESVNPFQLDLCPWCGTEIIPSYPSANDEDYGIRCSNSRFEFHCPTRGCEFYRLLPIQVVDEGLYDAPPTILVATVDKFAQLAWRGKGAVFFGLDKYLPPSLIIQDELHLISGPLGTIAALYEAAIDTLLSSAGAKPKFVASTATIRRADEQVRGLFGREVRVFPPAGLVADDSYFARTDVASPGRLYVGIMAPSHSSTTAQVDAMSALLQAPSDLDLSGKSLDAYWTLVAYHNSLKELGKTVTLLRDDIPLRIVAMAKDQSHARALGDDVLEQLTSESANTLEILARIKKSNDESGSLSVLSCTNMLSVGIDVSRLALMMIVGQPKTSSEYIQASSRVGRSDVPGLVTVLFRPTKPRDRSHYESFKAFHQSIYRYVEPTSVTPFAAPARDRALHAALVILARHAAGYKNDADAHDFDPSTAKMSAAIEKLRERARFIDEREGADTNVQIDRLLDKWAELKSSSTDAGRRLVYHGGRQFVSLLRRYGEPGVGWPTLDSMRNVDAECEVYVWGEQR